jgi:hypothetical protein
MSHASWLAGPWRTRSQSPSRDFLTNGRSLSLSPADLANVSGARPSTSGGNRSSSARRRALSFFKDDEGAAGSCIVGVEVAPGRRCVNVRTLPGHPRERAVRPKMRRLNHVGIVAARSVADREHSYSATCAITCGVASRTTATTKDQKNSKYGMLVFTCVYQRTVHLLSSRSSLPSARLR